MNARALLLACILCTTESQASTPFVGIEDWSVISEALPVCYDDSSALSEYHGLPVKAKPIYTSVGIIFSDRGSCKLRQVNVEPIIYNLCKSGRHEFCAFVPAQRGPFQGYVLIKPEQE